MALVTQPKTSLYCGDDLITASSFFRRDGVGGIAALFKGRQAYFSFNTRVAIRAACDLLTLQPGDEVLAPAYNCGSEVDPLLDAGLTVTLYPVGQDLVVDPARIAPLITPQTKAIYVTHFFGIIQPQLAELRQLCDQHDLRLIEDCALSLLSGPRPVEGRVGDVSVFCFHKFLPVVGGGALVINASDVAGSDPFANPPPRKVIAKKLVRAAIGNVLGAGRSQRVLQRLRGQPERLGPADQNEMPLDDIPRHYYFDPTLKNARISPLTTRALRGFSVSGVIAVRRENWQRYQSLLEGQKDVKLLVPDLPDTACPVVFPVCVTHRDRVAHDLQAQGIGATPWWAGFDRNLDWSGQTEAMDLKNTVLSLPLHQTLGQAHINHIVQQLRGAVAN